jgi:hypothetical protein
MPYNPEPPPPGLYVARRDYGVGGKRSRIVIARDDKIELRRCLPGAGEKSWVFHVTYDGAELAFSATRREFTTHFRKETR